MGEYYSSSGPEIYDWKVENNQFVVNCSAVERINMIVGGPVALGVTRLAEHGVPLTEAFYPLTGKETYIRAECIDENMGTRHGQILSGCQNLQKGGNKR